MDCKVINEVEMLTQCWSKWESKLRESNSRGRKKGKKSTLKLYYSLDDHFLYSHGLIDLSFSPFFFQLSLSFCFWLRSRIFLSFSFFLSFFLFMFLPLFLTHPHFSLFFPLQFLKFLMDRSSLFPPKKRNKRKRKNHP